MAVSPSPVAPGAPEVQRLEAWLKSSDDQSMTSETSRQYLFLGAGSAEVEDEGICHPLLPGSLLVVPAGHHCRIRASADSKGVLIRVPEGFLHTNVFPVFGAGPQYQWVNRNVLSIRDWWVGDGLADKRAQIMRELESARRRFRGRAKLAVLSYMLVVLAQPATFRGAGAKKKASSWSPRAGPNTLVRFRQLVEETYRHQLSVEKYSAMLGLSPAQLYRLCRATLDRSPHDLILERRFLEAERELTYSPNSIAEIAYGLGFREASYFSRRFKKHAGCAPSEYRRHVKIAHGTA